MLVTFAGFLMRHEPQGFEKLAPAAIVNTATPRAALDTPMVGLNLIVRGDSIQNAACGYLDFVPFNLLHFSFQKFIQRPASLLVV
jgi:hypothetical protein